MSRGLRAAARSAAGLCEPQPASLTSKPAGGPAPRWAVLARAGQLRGEGLAMKELPRGVAKAVG